MVNKLVDSVSRTSGKTIIIIMTSILYEIQLLTHHYGNEFKNYTSQSGLESVSGVITIWWHGPSFRAQKDDIEPETDNKRVILFYSQL